jgi:predicted TIM-barrel fold metal-dependent hydrolase
MAPHVPRTGYFRRALRDLARALDTEPAPEAVLSRLAARGPEVSGRALAERRVADLLVDTGYPPEAMTLDTMRARLPCGVHEVFRLETCAQALLAEALPCDDFLAALRGRLRAAARTAVALKTIIAYRSGLAVRAWPRPDVVGAYDAALARVRAGGSPRLVEKPLLDTLFLTALEVAAETDRPLQIHTGFGDPDIDLLQANPLLLRPVLEGPRATPARLVLLHMAYPYVREAAFMASVWPGVHVDLSLAIPFLGPGVVPPLIELLSLAPATKILYGSDVGALPELFAVVADWGRAALGEALGWLVERGGLTDDEARRDAARILSGNAGALYRLPGATDARR